MKLFRPFLFGIAVFLIFSSMVHATECLIAASNGGVLYRQNMKNAQYITIAIPGIPDAVFVDTADIGDIGYASFSSPSLNVHGIAVIDLTANTVIRTTSTGNDPRKLTLDETRKRLYVPCQNSVYLFDISVPAAPSLAGMIDISDFLPPWNAYEQIALSPDRTRLAALISNDVIFFNLYGDAAVATSHMTFPVPPRNIIFSLDGSKAFLFLMSPVSWTNQQGETLSGALCVLDSASGDLTDIISLNEYVDFAVMAGGRIYAGAANGILYRIDPVNETLLTPTTLFLRSMLDGALTGIAYAADGKLYICDAVLGVIHVITVAGDPAKDRVGRALELPRNSSPFGIAVIPEEPHGRKYMGNDE